MDWTTLFLNANGRIGQRDFWIAWLILFAATIILGWIPLLGHIISILLIYPTVCIFSKRLHDFGRSGWLTVIPYAVFFAALVIGMLTGGLAAIAAMGAPGSGAAGAAALTGFGIMGLMIILACIVGLVFLLWVGLSKGDPLPNRYGPPSVSTFGGVGTTPSAP